MTTRTTFKILTRKKNGQSHRETEVTIDWKSVSVDDLKILAKNAIVQDLQARIQRGDFDSFPVKVEILAKDIIHRESAALWEYRPNAVRPPKPPVLPRELEQLLKTLSPDELAKLLA